MSNNNIHFLYFANMKFIFCLHGCGGTC